MISEGDVRLMHTIILKRILVLVAFSFRGCMLKPRGYIQLWLHGVFFEDSPVHFTALEYR